MTICQISTVIPPSRSGPGDATFKIFRLLKARGISSCIITSTDQAPQAGVYPVVKQWSAGSLGILKKTLKEAKARTILFHYPSPRFRRYLSISLMPLFFRLLGLKVILYLYEYTSYSAIGRLRIWPMILASNQILVCDALIYKMLCAIPLLSPRISYLPVGSAITPRGPEEGQSSLGVKKREKLNLLYFGFMYRGKGLDVLLELFREDGLVSEKYSLHLVGGTLSIDEKYERGLLDLIIQSGRIINHGFLSEEDVVRVFTEMDVVVLPFEDGASGRRSSFLTAMAFGKPVVTTRPLIPMEGLEHGRNVLFVDSCTPIAIRGSLLDATDKGFERLSNIGSAAKEWYDERYNDKIFVEGLLGFIEDFRSHG